jgi:uncharacterized repeat protein (TIGR02543 family)
VAAVSEATTEGGVAFGDTILNYRQTLQQSGNAFVFTLRVESALSRSDTNTSADTSKNNYFTAPITGDYLVQLWGGDGGNGADAVSKGGQGGRGGYVYGVVHLTAGETLYYQLGGDGQPTMATDDGGGVNGDGGHHGNAGGMTVGGGGGYSAVYKFAPLEFEQKYTDGAGNQISEISAEDRATKYILIAGGGGGGGAGNGNSPILGITATGTADGGNGGTVGNTSGVLSGGGYDVEGTFFAGSDGKSSGTNSGFVGHGATNVPGEISSTLLTDWFLGKEPNDWRGTINTSYEGGSGGSGNLRGGAGGAGFCGGSGGVQAGLLSAYSVGGGGGGSSFIASSVIYSDINSILTDSGLDENPSSSGGAVYIRALDLSSLSYLRDLSFSAQIAPYFQAVPQASRNCSVAVSGDTLSITNADLIEHDHIQIELLFTPLSGFAGGNDVPLWNSNLSCSSDDGSHSVQMSFSDQCGYVNIPLAGFKAEGQTIDSNIPGEAYSVDALKGTNYDTWADQWMYGCIQSISEYTVDVSGDPTYDESTHTVAPTETTVYPVEVAVTPRPNQLAVVGTAAVKTTYKGKAIIRIGENSGILNGNSVTYSKDLFYNTEQQRYELKIETTITTDPTVEGTAGITFSEPTAVASNGNITYDTYKISIPGYYYIQAWGADGGKGSDALLGGDGGDGGSGRYESAYVYLPANQILKIVVGSVGAPGGNSGGWIGRQNYGGEGGGASGIMGVNGTDAYEIIAGGGGGGGGATGGSRGDPAQSNNAVNTGDRPTTITSYAGGKGGDSGDDGGIAGANYRGALLDSSPDGMPAMTVDIDALYEGGVLSSAKPTKEDGSENADGAVVITLIQQTFEEQTSIADYSITAQLSDYFVMAGSAANSVVYTGLTTGHTPAINYTSIDDSGSNLITISDIDPHVTETVNEKNHVFSATFTITLLLNPRSGFLGGNDVPILKSENSMKMQYQQADFRGAVQTLDIVSNHETDYANVVIPETNDWTKLANLGVYSSEEDPVTITAGGSVAHDQLYNKAELETTKANLESAGGWRDDYVEYNIYLVNQSTAQTEREDPLYPQHTTYYDIVLALDPKVITPGAVCIAPVTGRQVSAHTLIKVLPSIVYNLTNLVNSDKDALAANNGTIEAGADYTATLSAEDGYVLPAAITVTKRDGNGTITLAAGVDYTYNSNTGVIFIGATVIGSSEIIITAWAEEATFTLYCIYEQAPNTKHEVDMVTGLKPGDSLAGTLPHTYVPTAYPGYDFVWSWEYGDGSPLNKMPGTDVWVMGTYVPKEYTLTVRYVYENNSEAAVTHTEKVKYGSAYSVTSPTINGYMADQMVVSGTMPADDHAVTVVYTGTAEQLNIFYFKELPGGTLEQFDSYRNKNVTTGEGWSVPSPNLPGYTVESGKETLSGTMTADGITEQVIYRPNTYTVILDVNGGSCATSEITVVYDNIYGYDPVASGYTTEGGYGGLTGVYRALPTPARVGYTFDGWYTDNTWTQKVTEETVVSGAASHTLVAKWNAKTFTYTIRHVYEDGRPVGDSAPDYTLENVAGGTAIPPTDYVGDYVVTGYEADKTRADLVGTMPAQNVVVTITYVSTYRTLTVHYVFANNVEDASKRGTQAAPDHVDRVLVGGEYTVFSPTIDKYIPSRETVTGTMGTTDITVIVYYYDDDSPPVVSVTVTWGEMIFEYTHGTWDPQTHTYTNEPIHPVTAGTNYVMVTNNAESEISVNASFTYQANPSFEGLTHYFTATDSRNAARITESGMLAPGGMAGKAFLWLRGTLPRDFSGTPTVGVCTVTITGGG